mgnify:FL=1
MKDILTTFYKLGRCYQVVQSWVLFATSWLLFASYEEGVSAGLASDSHIVGSWPVHLPSICAGPLHVPCRCLPVSRWRQPWLQSRDCRRTGSSCVPKPAVWLHFPRDYYLSDIWRLARIGWALAKAEQYNLSPYLTCCFQSPWMRCRTSISRRCIWSGRISFPSFPAAFPHSCPVSSHHSLHCTVSRSIVNFPFLGQPSIRQQI